MSLEFREIAHTDARMLTDLFRVIDETFFRPHPFTDVEASRIASEPGRDAYFVLLEDDRAVAYGMLRGWSEGYTIPSLGIAVRIDCQSRGLGRLMMAHLHEEAWRRGATVIRLRVHPDNVRARRLYESLGYAYTGVDRDELVMMIGLALNSEGRVVGIPSSPTLQATLLDIDAPEWSAMLRSARHDFYHLPAYVALNAAYEHGQARALYVSGGGKAMLLPLVIRKIPGGGLDAISPYGYPGPIGIGIEDPAFLRVAMAAGVQTLDEAGLVSAFVRLHPLLNPFPLTGIGTYVRHGTVVSIDLTLPVEELWAQTRLNHRRDITRALRLGYVAYMDDSWRHMESFKHLYQMTMARRSAAQFYYFDDAYFSRLRDALRDSLHLCVVEKDGYLAAAGLFVETNGIVQYHLSGSDDASLAIQPTKLMMHHVRSWAKDRGDEVLHLGGGVGGESDSLLQFKIGFSPVRHDFATLRIVVNETKYSSLLATRDPQLDPVERSGFFPLYRQA